MAVQASDKDTFVSKFADDSKMGRVIKDISDCAKLQLAADHLVKWCNDWGMSLNPQKCIVLHFGRNNPMHKYTIGKHKLAAASNARDLGVIVDTSCKPSLHVNKIAKRAHAVLSQVRRATTIRDSQTFPQLYKTFIRPLLESAAPVWSPSKREDVSVLERVQRRAFRMISDMGHMSYDEKLQSLGVQTLEDRRRRGDAIEIFKTINGFNDVDPATWFNFVRDRHDLNTRSFVDNGIVPEKASLNIRRNFFTNRAAKVWNSLPTDIKSATSVNAFKNGYDYYYIKKCTVPN